MKKGQVITYHDSDGIGCLAIQYINAIIAKGTEAGLIVDKQSTLYIEICESFANIIVEEIRSVLTEQVDIQVKPYLTLQYRGCNLKVFPDFQMKRNIPTVYKYRWMTVDNESGWITDNEKDYLTELQPYPIFRKITIITRASKITARRRELQEEIKKQKLQLKEYQRVMEQNRRDWEKHSSKESYPGYSMFPQPYLDSDATRKEKARNIKEFNFLLTL